MGQYAFLNAVYTDNDDNSEIYEVVFCTEDFTKDSVYRTNLEGLKQLSAREGLTRDFYFDGDYLRCTELPRVIMNDIVKQTVDKEQICLDFNQHSGTMLNFLKFGVVNDLYVLDDRVVGYEEWLGSGLTGFKRIKFSQSSMSVYVHMVFENTIRNLYLIRMEGQKLKSLQFYFAAPKGKKIPEEYGEKIKSMKINNKDFDVYMSKELSLFEDVGILSPALINKACTLRTKLTSLENVLKLFINSDRKNLQWVDSGVSGHSGVLFESSLDNITRGKAVPFAEKIMEIRSECGTVDEFVKRVNVSYDHSSLSYFIIMLIGKQLYKYEDSTSLIAELQNLNESISELIFNADLYLYRIRLYLSYTNNSFLLRSRILSGSDENAYTLVKGGYYEL